MPRITDKTCHIDGRSNRPSLTVRQPQEPPATVARRFLDEIADGGPDSADIIREQRERRAANDMG